MTRLFGILIALLASGAAAQDFDLTSRTATGGTYVLSDDNARRAYALLAARIAFPDSTLVQRSLVADKLVRCLDDATGADDGSASLDLVAARKSPLFDLASKCIKQIEDSDQVAGKAQGDPGGDFGYGATGEEFMAAKRARQLEHVVGVATFYDMNAPRARVVALAGFLDDCLRQAMTPSRGVSRQSAQRVRARKLGLLTETCLVLWERR